MIVRPASEADLDGAAACVADQPLFERYGTRPADVARWLTSALAAGEGVIVACEGSQVVGFAWFLERGTFGAGSYLRLIAVARSWQSRGVGAALLDEFEAAAGPQAFLLVSDFNSSAQRFYEAHGYRQVGRLPDFVKPGIAELIYWKRRAG